MKKLSLILAIVSILLFTNNFNAQDSKSQNNQELVTATFKVYGNCGMCQSRIEKAAKLVEGVKEVGWDKDTKIIKVKYDDIMFAEHNNSIDVVSVKIAEAGHDTQFNSSTDENYNNLPGCCQYDRKEN